MKYLLSMTATGSSLLCRSWLGQCDSSRLDSLCRSMGWCAFQSQKSLQDHLHSQERQTHTHLYYMLQQYVPQSANGLEVIKDAAQRQANEAGPDLISPRFLLHVIRLAKPSKFWITIAVIQSCLEQQGERDREARETYNGLIHGIIENETSANNEKETRLPHLNNYCTRKLRVK